VAHVKTNGVGDGGQRESSFARVEFDEVLNDDDGRVPSIVRRCIMTDGDDVRLCDPTEAPRGGGNLLLACQQGEEDAFCGSDAGYVCCFVTKSDVEEQSERAKGMRSGWAPMNAGEL
jgi:hypothetical protein